jgi:hypothetical protein
MSNERKSNKHIRDYLQVAFQLTNDYTSKKWTESNQEDIMKDVKQRQVVQGGMRFQEMQKLQDELREEKQAMSGGSASRSGEENGEPDTFAEMLGLKDMSVENVMHNARNDEAVEDLMAQDSNFIKTQEGYPMFLRDQNPGE